MIPAGTWEVDPTQSSVKFQVKHMVIATVNGRFTVFAGALEAGEDGALHAHSTVQVATIDTNLRKRDEHLRSADFFDAAAHPQIRFTSTEITPTGGTSLRITGRLTIKGQTRPVELTAEVGDVRVVPWGNERIKFVLRGELNRKDFGLTWNTVLAAGGALLSDRVKIEAHISAVKRIRRVKPARTTDMPSLALGSAIVYLRSRADAKPAQKVAKRSALEPVSGSAPRPANGGAEE